MLGFIILRHINSNNTNLFWKESYKCIRRWYPDNPIVIIDDNSNTFFVTEIELINTIIIQSEFPRRAELLPYYYFLKHAWFDTAVIIHDSVFIQKPIKFSRKNMFLWHFETHEYDNIVKESELISSLQNHDGLLEFYKSKEKWNGCFGVMSVISWEMLNHINSKYNFFKLLNSIRCRNERMFLERVFAATLWYESNLTKEACSYFGNIETYCRWSFNESYLMEDYENDVATGRIKYPIIKLWTGR